MFDALSEPSVASFAAFFSSLMGLEVGDADAELAAELQEVIGLLLQVQHELGHIENTLNKIESMIIDTNLNRLADPLTDRYNNLQQFFSNSRTVMDKKTMTPQQQTVKIRQFRDNFVSSLGSEPWDSIDSFVTDYYKAIMSQGPQPLANVFTQHHNSLVPAGASSAHSDKLRTATGTLLDLQNYFPSMRGTLTKLLVPLNQAISVLRFVSTPKHAIQVNSVITKIRGHITAMFNFVQSSDCSYNSMQSTGLISCPTLKMMHPKENSNLWLQYQPSGKSDTNKDALFFTFQNTREQSHCIQETSEPHSTPAFTNSNFKFSYADVPTDVSRHGQAHKGHNQVPPKAWQVSANVDWGEESLMNPNVYFTYDGDNEYMCMVKYTSTHHNSFQFFVTFFPTQIASDLETGDPLPTPGLSMRMVTGFDDYGFCYIVHSGGYMQSAIKAAYPSYYCRNDGPEVYFWLQMAKDQPPTNAPTNAPTS